MNARITLVGMENELNYLTYEHEGQQVGRSLTDAWEFSNEEIEFDPQTLLATIILKGGSFEPLYTDPLFFYKMNGFWWKKWCPTFQKWLEASQAEYNPLWDRNGYEQIHEDTYDVGTNDTVTENTEVMDDDTTYRKSGSSTEVMDDDTTGSSNTTTENKVSAYDANDYQPASKSTENTGTSGTDDRTTTVNWSENGSGTDDKTTTQNGTIDNDSTNDRDFDREYHSWGNWGISQTSQKLLESEFIVRYKYNPYELMSDIFLNELAVRVF